MVRVLATLEKTIDEYSQEGSRTSQPWRMSDPWLWCGKHTLSLSLSVYTSFYCPTRCAKWLKVGGIATSLHVISLRIYWLASSYDDLKERVASYLISFHCSVLCVILSSPGSLFRKHHPAQLQLGSLATYPSVASLHEIPLGSNGLSHDLVPWVFC